MGFGGVAVGFVVLRYSRAQHCPRARAMIQFFSETVAMDAGDTDDAVTDLLRRWVDGDTPAGDRLFTRVYEELRVVARRQRQRWNGEDTLNTTASQRNSCA